MAVATVVDLTIDFNADALSTVDLSSWDWAVLQLVTPSAAIAFTASNDDGSITGVEQGNSTLAINFTAVQGTNLATGTAETTSATATGMWRFPIIGRFLRLSGAGGTTAAKILLYLQKIS